jgi:alkylation response protein AidB-like acyl-CoA dehydrogenase
MTMDLTLTEEQTMLQRAAKDFVASRAPLARTRKVAASGDGASREVWQEMAKLGWLGLTVSEEHGGAGLGHRYLMVVLEELGKALVPEPLLSTAVLGATAIELGGSKAVRAEQLAAIVAGDRVVALAHQEKGGRFALGAIDTQAAANGKSGDGYVLRGEKIHVMDGTVADWLVVSARAADGVALFLVPVKGTSPTKGLTVDGRRASTGAARPS